MLNYPQLSALWQRVTEGQIKGLLISVTNSTLTVLSSTALMANSAYIISFAALRPSIADIMIPVTMVRFFGIARAVLRYTERLISHNTVFAYLSRLRVSLYKGYTQISGRALLRLSKTDALQTLTADIEVLQDFFLRALLPLLSSSLIGLAITGLLLITTTYFAPVFVVLYLLATLGMAYIAFRLTRGHSEKHATALGQYKQDYTEFSEGVTELKLNKRIDDYATRMTRSAAALEKEQEQVALSRIFASNGQQLIIYMTVFIALIFGIMAVERGMNGIYLAVITLVMFSFYEAAPAFLTLFQKLEASEYSAQRMNQVYSLEQRGQFSGALDQLPKAIVFKDFTYQYSQETGPIALSHLSLKAGEKIAVVGPSGAGKSTIAAMLTGLLEPLDGHFTLDDKHYDSQSSNVLQQLFSVVSQNVYLFNRSLKDNLRLGKVDATDEELAQALQEAGLGDWLNTDWYQADPWIGENGMSLSGGQRQRLALARAFLRKSPFIVLDEAFAGLDKATEREVLSKLLNKENLGLIWVTHRLIEMAKLDRIYVVDKGAVVAVGRHEELLANSPLYKAMYDTQNNLIE